MLPCLTLSQPTPRQALVDAQRHPDAYGFEEVEGAAEAEEEKELARVNSSQIICT